MYLTSLFVSILCGIRRWRPPDNAPMHLALPGAPGTLGLATPWLVDIAMQQSGVAKMATATAHSWRFRPDWPHALPYVAMHTDVAGTGHLLGKAWPVYRQSMDIPAAPALFAGAAGMSTWQANVQLSGHIPLNPGKTVEAEQFSGLSASTQINWLACCLPLRCSAT